MRALASLVAVIALMAVPVAAQQSTVGTVSFPNSGAPEAQNAFLHGLAQLHNFEYPLAAEAFREAQEIDPDFAMAYWGEAMTHNHPIWMEQDREAALAVLERLAPTEEARLASAPTDRERGLLEAIHVLYGDGEKETRDDAYAEAMAALHERFPDDPDITAFYALSILGTAHEGRDFGTYMRAAGVAERAFDAHPRHPGLAHYLIHSYDDPIHAPLGLRPAEVYGDIAPEAPHAQHMTSHIFVAAGMWDRVVEANEIAASQVNARRVAAGREESYCGHYNRWLVYGWTQTGMDLEAATLVDLCREEAIGAAAGDGDLESFAEMRARFVIDTEDWALNNVEPFEFPEDAAAERMTARYTDAIAAAYRDDEAAFRAALDAFMEAKAALPAYLETHGDEGHALARAEVLELQLRGLASLAEGDTEAGVERLAEAAAVESEIPLMFGPPFIDKPSFELLGEVLIELGSYEEARLALDRAIALTPNRRAISIARERLEERLATR